MYEDKTFENLQEEMREESDYEGQFVDASIAKQAVRLEEGYADLANVYDNISVDTKDLDHLVEFGAESGVPYLEGTPATVVAYMNCQVDPGTEFTATDSEYNYIVTQYVGTITENDVTWYKHYMEADDPGVEPGEYRGDIEPIDEADGFEEGSIVSTYEAGTDDEDEEVYRERLQNSFSSRSCAGNRAYFHDTIHDAFSVGGVKSMRRTEEDTDVHVYIQAADYGVPSSTLIDQIADTMDPDGLVGEGLGLSPFGVELAIHAVTGVDIAVTATFAFDTGYTFSGLKSAIEAAADEYLLSLRNTWEEGYLGRWENTSGIIVRISGLESAMLGVEGVLDVGDATINGEASNLTLSVTEIPVLSGVSENG